MTDQKLPFIQAEAVDVQVAGHLLHQVPVGHPAHRVRDIRAIAPDDFAAVPPHRHVDVRASGRLGEAPLPAGGPLTVVGLDSLLGGAHHRPVQQPGHELLLGGQVDDEGEVDQAARAQDGDCHAEAECAAHHLLRPLHPASEAPCLQIKIVKKPHIVFPPSAPG